MTDNAAERDDFQALFAECLDQIEREGTIALERFRAEHPAFASRLGKQMDWLVEHLYVRARPDLPQQIGPYRIRCLIGAGGMGEVYLGEQTVPFRRIVAVKVIRLDVDTQPRLARFATEIQALASLNHNGIAKVFEAGTADGRPFFAMEYVPGQPITAYCAEHELPVAARLSLVVDVCRAVEHAHQQGIIHRDLKPSNILVSGPPSAPEAKIIDFGLAKAIRPGHLDERTSTQTGALLGTPDYMSPEQTDESGTAVVDTRTDVYALGVVLYQLLTGLLPLSLSRAPAEVLDMIKAIREQRPSPPSLRVARGRDSCDAFAKTCGLASHRQLRRQLQGDLDCIVMKSLAKSAADRYGSVAHLADDLLRHARIEPVSAQLPTVRYVLTKFVQRHRAAVSVAASVLVLVVASLITVEAYAMESRRRLEQGNMFGLVFWLDRVLRREWQNPPAARPEQVGAMQSWLRDVEAILGQRQRMAEFLREPATRQPDPSDPADWASGANMLRELQASLANEIKELHRAAADQGTVDQVRKRMHWAEHVVDYTVDRYREDWERVRKELADDRRFPVGCDLQPQVGLVPIGVDQVTKLQEFAYLLPGGDLPLRRNGRLEIGATTCPVFVLLPGGAVAIGSQKDDPSATNYDPAREPDEPGLANCTIEPFFASKFEFTNGQWRLLTPPDSNVDTSHPLMGPTQPIMAVPGDAILHTVRAWGMRLPTAAEWDYLARGGKDTPMWCGRSTRDLEGKENLFDASYAEGGEGVPVPWSDGFPYTAPVGSFVHGNNGYGLYDVLGNVCEVCTIAPGNTGAALEVRGSSWHMGAKDARVTGRFSWDGSARPSIGFRPAISVQR